MDNLKSKKHIALFALVLVLLLCLFAICFPSLSQYRTRVEVDTVNLSIIEYTEPTTSFTIGGENEKEWSDDWTENINAANQ